MSGNKRFSNRVRKVWTILVVAMVVGLLLGACGPQKPKVYHVGILSGLDFFADTTDGFKAGMAGLGYVEGQNIVYDVQKTNFDMAVYKSIVQKFVADKVDLIFAFPTEASIEAKAATQGTNIPVVFSSAFTEDTDLVKSVREPGGNITGVRFPGPEIALKRFEILHQLVPQAKRIWAPYQQGYPGVDDQLGLVRQAAAAVGVTLIEFPASSAAELDAELQARAQSGDIGIDAILFIAEPLDVAPDAFLVLTKFAAEHKLPVGGALMEMEGYGTIYGVSIDPVNAGKQAAALADKIFKGTSAGTIPVVSPELFVQINYRRAQQLGLTVPEGLLKQADEVIR